MVGRAGGELSCISGNLISRRWSAPAPAGKHLARRARRRAGACRELDARGIVSAALMSSQPVDPAGDPDTSRVTAPLPTGDQEQDQPPRLPGPARAAKGGGGP